MSVATERMRTAWGDRAPEWIEALATACDRASQAEMTRRLRQADGFPSASVINQVLQNKYTGKTDRIRGLVEGLLLGSTVDCPVLGDLRRDLCLEYQARPFAATNSQRVRLYRACHNGCPHSRIKE